MWCGSWTDWRSATPADVTGGPQQHREAIPGAAGGYPGGRYGAGLTPSRSRSDRSGYVQCAAVTRSRPAPWRMMPKRVRPYGSAEDAESAGLGRSRPGTAGEDVSEPGGMMAMRDVADQAAEAIRALRDLTSGGSAFAGLADTREVIASLERVGQDLPQLCEQLARILVVQREESQLAAGAGQDPDFWVVEAVEALAAAGQAADMMTAALAQAGKTAGELRPAR